MFKPINIEKSGLSKDVIEKVKNCLSKFSEIDQAILYGSRAKGTYRNGSDIDLSLIGKSLNPQLILRLDSSLDELMLPYSFDISIYEQIDNSNFKDHIDRVGVILYQRQ